MKSKPILITLFCVALFSIAKGQVNFAPSNVKILSYTTTEGDKYTIKNIDNGLNLKINRREGNPSTQTVTVYFTLSNFSKPNQKVTLMNSDRGSSQAFDENGKQYTVSSFLLGDPKDKQNIGKEISKDLNTAMSIQGGFNFKNVPVSVAKFSLINIAIESVDLNDPSKVEKGVIVVRDMPIKWQTSNSNVTTSTPNVPAGESDPTPSQTITKPTIPPIIIKDLPSTKMNWLPLGMHSGEISDTIISKYKFVFAPDGIPYVVYSTVNTGGFTNIEKDKIKVKKYNPATNTWVQVGKTIERPNHFTIDYFHLAVSQDGVPYLLFSNTYLTETDIITMKYNGNAWVDINTIKMAKVGSETPKVIGDLTIAPNGTLYTGCFATAAATSVYEIMKFDGSDFNKIESVKVPYTGYEVLPLKIAQNGTLYCGYIGSTLFDHLGNTFTLKKYNGNSWTNIGKPVPAVSFGGHSKYGFTITADGTPYFYFTEGSGVTVMKYSDGEWNKVVYTETLSTYNKYVIVNAIGIDKDGVPYVILYSDATKLNISKYNANAWLSIYNQNADMKKNLFLTGGRSGSLPVFSPDYNCIAQTVVNQAGHLEAYYYTLSDNTTKK